jgi:hypothetical protein
VSQCGPHPQGPHRSSRPPASRAATRGCAAIVGRSSAARVPRAAAGDRWQQLGGPGASRDCAAIAGRSLGVRVRVAIDGPQLGGARGQLVCPPALLRRRAWLAWLAQATVTGGPLATAGREGPLTCSELCRRSHCNSACNRYAPSLDEPDALLISVMWVSTGREFRHCHRPSGRQRRHILYNSMVTSRCRSRRCDHSQI